MCLTEDLHHSTGNSDSAEYEEVGPPELSVKAMAEDDEKTNKRYRYIDDQLGYRNTLFCDSSHFVISILIKDG